MNGRYISIRALSEPPKSSVTSESHSLRHSFTTQLAAFIVAQIARLIVCWRGILAQNRDRSKTYLSGQGKASVAAVQILMSARYWCRLGCSARYFSTISDISLNVTFPGMQK